LSIGQGGDAVTVFYSDIRGGWYGPGSNNINSNPLFSDSLYHLSEYSPCIDTGNPDTVGLSIPPWDLDGNVRIWDGNGDGVAVIDMGVYEYGSPVYSVHETEVSEENIIFNYPNPFNTSTTISFYETMNVHEEVQVEIYNLKGQKVKKFLIVPTSPGHTISVIWDGKDDKGRIVTNGIYFCKVSAEKREFVKKLVLIR